MPGELSGVPFHPYAALMRALRLLAATAFVAGPLVSPVVAQSAPATAAPALPTASPTASRPVVERVRALHALLGEQWEYTLRTQPEFASILGDRRYNDRLSDYSPAAVERDLAATRDFERRFAAIDPAGFPEQERLNRDLMLLNLRTALEGARFREWETPVTQMQGLHIDLPQLVTSLPFETVKDYDDYVARLRATPLAFQQVTDQMRRGMRDGLMPPKILLAQAVAQSERLARQQPDSSPFAVPLGQTPNSFGPADRDRLHGAVLAAIRDSVLPAYVRFTAFLRDEYAPHGRDSIGTWALPDGQARYAYAVRRQTTTTLTPREIHELGLREVARIEGEQLAIARRLGFASVQAMRDSLPKMPALHPASREQILDEYRKYIGQMYAKLPTLFGRLPKAKLEVLPVEPFREKEASTAYNQGTPDGSRPGHVFVNTYDFAKQLTINNESTAYHEGVPGHHMQISIAQELPSLPPFRQQAQYTAYVEGWALYSERLGKEVGFYQDPYNDYGRLDDEMLRAIRLVLDTGIHDRHWTRDEAVAFFRAHSSESEPLVQSETDRYIAWPGQALAYKVGQLTILRLRDAARQALGPRFDLRAFHDEVLGAGALPMDVFEARMRAWVARGGAGDGRAE
ncbi:X-Pro dipeptidyl-peptidase [Gemmatimonadetes bacterium T265]|nr:X-Pro dipeptidyl-peptidase [Gemmatimonadetes bacterium T265]